MPWFKTAFLIAVLLISSGYRFRCYWMCTDQTAIQHDYIELRDTCRDYAEAKVDMTLRNMNKYDDTDERRAQLVALFSQCMAEHGWTVPDGKDPSAAPVIAKDKDKENLTPAEIAQREQQKKLFLARKAECDFARQSAKGSSVAAARAQACDIECSQRIKTAPDAPRPAACPSEFNPNLTKGVDKGEL